MTALALVQGMRRSGTTILYDLLCEDPALACFYEPLAAARPSIGGGSGVQDVDVFESVHEARRDFAREHPELTDPSVLNHGAPRDWRLEFERDLPPLIRAYLQFLFARDDAVAVKFTRMSRKIPALAEIAGDARFIQVVRDPRAVVVSYLFGKGHRRREELSDPDRLFSDRTDWTQWSSFEFSEHLRLEQGLPADLRDFERILAIWRDAYEETRRGAEAGFRGRWMLVRNEDLRRDPTGTMGHVYELLGRPLPVAVERFAQAAVHPEQTIVAPDDGRWVDAYRRLGMLDLVREAGYLT